MIQLDLPAMAGAMALMALLFLHLQRRQLRLESGDTWEGIWGTLVRTGLHRLTTAARQERLWTAVRLCPGKTGGRSQQRKSCAGRER
jgi:hypothetical protein